MNPPRVFHVSWSTVWRGTAAIFCVLLLMELVLRFWIVSPSAVVPDPEFQYFDRPYSWHVHSAEGYSRNNVNRLGLNDDDPWDPKPPLRALLVGDSYSEAKQVSLERNFAAVAEQAVEGLEVCNAGRSGWGPPDLAAFVERRAHLFRPDLIVVQLNDPDLDELLRPAKIHLIRQDGGYRLIVPRPAPEPGAAQRIGRQLKQNSALFTQVAWRIGRIHQMEKDRLTRHFSAPTAHASRDSKVPSYPDDAIEMLTFLHARMKKQYDDIVYVYIPRILYEEPTRRMLKYPDRRAIYREFAKRVGAPLVDPTDAIIEQFLKTRQPLHGFHNSRMGSGHVNERGHAVIGRLLAAELKKRLP